MQQETEEVDAMSAQILDSLVYLRDESGYRFWEAAVGGIPRTEGKADFTKYKFVKDYLTMENLLQLKERGATFGALSNEELQMIANSATKLRQTLPEGEWDIEINNIIQRLTQGDERMKEYLKSGQVTEMSYDTNKGSVSTEQVNTQAATSEGTQKALDYLADK